MKSHLKGMVVAAAPILIVLLAVGVRPAAAVPWAAALACPLMMIAMMAWMDRRGHAHDDHGTGHSDGTSSVQPEGSAPTPAAAPTGH